MAPPPPPSGTFGMPNATGMGPIHPPGSPAAPVPPGTAPIPLQAQSQQANSPSALAAGIARMAGPAGMGAGPNGPSMNQR